MLDRTLLVGSLVLFSLACGGSDDTPAGAVSGSSGSAGTSATAGASGASGSSGGAGSSGTGGGTGAAGSSGQAGTSGTGGDGGTAGASAGAAGTNGANGSNGASGTGGSAGSAGSAGSSGASAGTAGAAGGASLPIGEWSDSPGVCPSGAPQKDITTVSQLEDASRGEGDYENDPPDTCYLIHDGTYTQNGSTLLMYIEVGGTDATHRRIFVGQSRAGVVIHGRATIDSGVSHVQVTNLTFDLNGYSQTGSFNTFSILDGSVDLRVDHIDFTGDCATGANGGHVEVDGSSDVVVESCLIEKFGRCGPEGHQEHGVYLASGSNIVIRNNDIRGNASRGIQFNTEGGDFGTLDHVTIEQNRIHDNGHGDYEDGIVLNATGTGNISNVTIQHNLFYTNYYSAIRVVGTVFDSISVTKNTFFHDGGGSSSENRSEANIDSDESGAHAVFSKNIFVAATGILVLNNCYVATANGYSLSDNIVQGNVPSGSDGACITGSVSVDPMLSNPAGFDFHTSNAATDGYGAYAE